MDFEQDNNLSGPGEPAAGMSQGTQMTRTAGRGAGWKVFFGVILALSIMANVFLVVMLIGVVAVFATGQRGLLAEEVVREGPRSNKIAVIDLQGVIYAQEARDVLQQLKRAKQDKRVKGLILRINSPGGSIWGSDHIYKEILKYREEENKPVVAFMQGLAASGGYYASAACEKIVAEPTTITGSIGVISYYFVVQELLEEKLGILPIVVKSGERKDWPSSFRTPSEDQLAYMEEKLIRPAYERFVEIVAEGRKDVLTPADVKRLADGSIYGAQEALDEKLIDGIGYLDDAIKEVTALAGIDKAQVVQYRKPFSLAGLLSYSRWGMMKFDKETLYELSTPEIMYLWSAY